MLACDNVILFKRCGTAMLNGTVDAYAEHTRDVKDEEDWCSS